MQMEHCEDYRMGWLMQEIHPIRKAAQQTTAYILIDFRELQRMCCDPLEDLIQGGKEPSTDSLAFDFVPRYGLINIGVRLVQNIKRRTHGLSSEGCERFRSISSRTCSQGRTASGSLR